MTKRNTTMLVAPRLFGPAPHPPQTSLEVREGPPKIVTVDDALFLPPLSAPPGRRPDINGRGGIFDRDGAFVPASATLRRGGRHGLEPEAYDEAQCQVDEEVLYLGFLMPQYGHAMLEGTARLWAIQALGWQGRLLVHAENPDLLRAPDGAFIPELLDLFGICSSRLLIPAVPTRFRRIHVPWPAFSFSGVVHRCFPAQFERVARQWAGDVTPCDGPLYLAKNRSAAVKPDGEAELIAVLERKGFVVAHPQEMSLQEQIRLVNRHRHVVGPLGSALHNHLFSLRETAVTALWACQPYWETLGSTTAIKGNPLTLLTSSTQPSGGNDWEMDVDAVLRYLEDSGLMARPRLPWRAAVSTLVRQGPFAAVRERRAAREVAGSRFFDEGYYLARNPDVAATEMAPVIHFLRHGAGEMRDPSPLFHMSRYLEANPDVAEAGCNPLLHYLAHGRREGRRAYPVPAEPPAQAGAAALAFCTVVDARTPKRDLAYSLVASWHRHCRQWSSLHVVLVGRDEEFQRFAESLGAQVVPRAPHPLSDRLVFANKWLVGDLDLGGARPVLLDWDMVFVGDPWLLRALPTHCFGARPAPALRLPPALQRWILEQFRLPRGLNVAAMEVALKHKGTPMLGTGALADVIREFRYYNGGLLAIPPGRLREVMASWQSNYELLVDRISCVQGAADLPGVKESVLSSDQLALAITLAWESVYSLDPGCNFFAFDYVSGHSRSDISILHLAGPAYGAGLQAALATFDAQLAQWHPHLRQFPRFDPSMLRGEIESLVNDYKPQNVEGHREWSGPAHAANNVNRSSDLDSLHDGAAHTASAVDKKNHREMVGGLWSEIGSLQFNYLREQGLRPDDHLLDIGCGSLRGGVHFASYLESGRYWGVDANGALLRAGREELVAAGISDRVPDSNLLEDSEFDFERLGRTFDAALAQSLFTHLSSNEIILCLHRLAKVMRPHARLFATYFEVPELHPLDEAFLHPCGIRSYAYKDPFHYTQTAVAGFISDMPWRLVAVQDWRHPRNQRMMILERLPFDSNGSAAEIYETV